MLYERNMASLRKLITCSVFMNITAEYMNVALHFFPASL